MDEIINEERLDDFVRKQIELDVPVSVVKQGELGSYRRLIHENGLKCEDGATTIAELLSPIRTGPESVHYVCFDELEGVSREQNIGFSYVASVDSSAEQRMGFATISLSGKLQYDPYLRWVLPENCWSSEEAATVMYTYTLAYKLLVLLPSYRWKYAKTAMINMGTEYSLAEAFIVLSLYKDLEIFVTVDSDEDAARIKNRFPEIPNDHILFSKNCGRIQVKRIAKDKSKENRIDLVVNCLHGMEHLETSLDCVAVNGTYVEVGTGNCRGSNEIGLFPFLRGSCAYVMRKEVTGLSKLPVETKQIMQKFIDDLIKKEVMKPLEIDRASMKSINMADCLLSREIENCPTRGIKYCRKRSYLIVGTSVDDSSLFELIEWLMNEGARKFMIVLEELPVVPPTMDRINSISTDANACILWSSASKLDDKEETVSFLEEIEEKLDPLEAIFYVGLRKAGRKISNLNDLVSPDVYFVGLCSAGLKEFEQRSARGSPATLLHAKQLERVIKALPRLNDLLAKNDNNNAEILYHVANPDTGNRCGVKVPRFSLRDYLPYNVDVLSVIGQDEEMVEPIFEEITSLSRRYHHCKGVYPIFALPAVHSSTLQPLFQRLQHPVFSAMTTSMSSVKDVAGTLYSALIKIQCTGPISLISETWTLPLALELLSYAKRDGRDYKIFALEGIPEIWSDRVKRLKSMDPGQQDMLFANEIFHFIEKSWKRDASVDVPFEKKIRMLAEQVSGDPRTVENVLKGARKTRMIIAGLTRLRFSAELLENVIWIERSRPSEDVLKLSVTSEILVFDEPNYRGLLDHPEVSRAIDRNALYSWWKYTKPGNME